MAGQPSCYTRTHIEGSHRAKTYWLQGQEEGGGRTVIFQVRKAVVALVSLVSGSSSIQWDLMGCAQERILHSRCQPVLCKIEKLIILSDERLISRSTSQVRELVTPPTRPSNSAHIWPLAGRSLGHSCVIAPSANNKLIFSRCNNNGHLVSDNQNNTLAGRESRPSIAGQV